MQINNLVLRDFRNYGSVSLSFDSRCNVIYGENAQGKTNLLEAIHFLSCGRSPRARRDSEMVGFEKESALIEGQIESRERDFKTAITLYRGKRRKMTVNGVPAKKNADLSEVLHTVFFAPEDLYLIRDGAAARRKFMDHSLSQLRPRYAEALSEYSRLYDHKTRILRDADLEPGMLKMLPDFNERLCQVGAVLIYYRARFCEALSGYAYQAHHECSGGREELSLLYKTVSTVLDPLADVETVTDQLRRHQADHYQAELASRLCLSGPHKDDIEVEVNGQNARQYCSQGQVRTAALSLKLAEREIHKNTFGEYPLMLLDDVLSELDAKRQEYVLNRISEGQIFITCCESDRLSSLLRGKVFQIKNGEVV